MRLIGRLNLAGGITTPDGNLQNAVVHKGDTYPSVVAEGQLFFRTDTKALMVYNGTSWSSAGAGLVNPLVADLDAGGYAIKNVLGVETQYLVPPYTTPTPATFWEIGEVDIGGDKYPTLKGHCSSTSWEDLGVINKALIIYNESLTDAPTIVFANGAGIGSVFTMDLASTPPRCRILGTFGVNTISGGFGKALELDNSLFAGSGDPGDGVRISFRAKHQGGGLGTGFDTGYIDVVMTDSTELGYKTEMSFSTCDTASSPSLKMKLDESGIQASATGAFYFGDKDTDGTWRIVRSGNNLVFERRESGSYVTKQTMTP